MSRNPDYPVFMFRKAIHVGSRPFGQQSSDVYYSMIDDFMRSERETLEFLLEHYKVILKDKVYCVAGSQLKGTKLVTLTLVICSYMMLCNFRSLFMMASLILFAIIMEYLKCLRL